MELEMIGWISAPIKPQKRALDSVLVSFPQDPEYISIRDFVKKSGSQQKLNQGNSFCPKKQKSTNELNTNNNSKMGIEYDKTMANDLQTGVCNSLSTIVFETRSPFDFDQKTIDPVDYSYNLRLTGYSSFSF
jgi:hypothetical protein